jgi:hypothetical protein
VAVPKTTMSAYGWQMMLAALVFYSLPYALMRRMAGKIAANVWLCLCMSATAALALFAP